MTSVHRRAEDPVSWSDRPRACAAGLRCTVVEPGLSRHDRTSCAPRDRRAPVLHNGSSAGHPGRDAGPDLAEEPRAWVKTRFAAHARPRIVQCVPELPSGKQRSVLRYAERRSR